MTFQISVPQQRLDDIRQRIADYRWYAPVKDEAGATMGWRYGVDIAYLRELAAHWLDHYDWRETERRINSFDNFRAELDGLGLHYLREKGSGAAPQPLLIVHGWPYSFLSYLGVIEHLAHPERFGGDAEDGFDVVLVSLPGSGFSDAPPGPMGFRTMATLLNRLMTGLGYQRYLVDGGDQGAAVASYIALDHADRISGLHHSMVFPRHAEAPLGMGQAGADATSAEQDYVLAEMQRFMLGGAYLQLQVTGPETLAPALMDSPVGLAAWVIDKYHAWTDSGRQPFDSIIAKDKLLDEIMLFLVSDTFRTSLWPYAAIQTELPTLAPGEKIMVPTGVAAWPDPWNPIPPREFVARSRGNIVHWADMPAGGHFPFYEEPDLYVQDLRKFGRTIRRIDRVNMAQNTEAGGRIA